MASGNSKDDSSLHNKPAPGVSIPEDAVPSEPSFQDNPCITFVAWTRDEPIGHADAGIQTSFFTPAQEPPAGTGLYMQKDGDRLPKLFTPLTIRGMTMPNRIMLSPLDQYSGDDGHQTDWHIAHLGGIIKRGPGLSMVEALAVTPEGRVTPEDSALWKDSQIAPLKRIVDFAHSQGQKIAVQLAHAGRKGSTVAPWIVASEMATEEHGGWPTKLLAPSAIPYKENHNTPTAMTLEDIAAFKKAWGAAVKRALQAGFDCIEIHAAHGYLLHEFHSPVSNTRTDAYGGSFANRTRLTLETVRLTRALIPSTMPLFIRVSATDWLEDVPGFENPNTTSLDAARTWTPTQTVAFATLLAEAGVDVLDVSSGGNHPSQRVKGAPAYQAPFAQAVKRALPPDSPMSVMTVGGITTGALANALLEGTADEENLREGKGVELDLVAVGRGFQRNPGLVWAWADELGVEAQIAHQIRWGFKGRGKKRPAKATATAKI